GHDVIHCFERDCSLQRRRQKVWEEAPAVAVPARVREALCASAIALAKAVRYRGAGTLEYLYDDATQAFYFIEMNTRIQVEHPVTEMITGLDLVRLMIQIAGGERLSLRQDEIRVRGHSIQVRINAEDPANNFAPFPGKVETLMTPGGNGVRFDTMLFAGYQIPPFYDSLLGKLIVWDDTRDRARAPDAGFARVGDRRLQNDEAASSGLGGRSRGPGGNLRYALARASARPKRASIYVTRRA